MIQFDRWWLTIRGTQNIYNGQSLGIHSPSDYTKDEEMYYKRLAAAIIYSTAVEYAEYIAKNSKYRSIDDLPLKAYYENWFKSSWFDTLTLGKIDSGYFIGLIYQLASKKKNERNKNKNTRIKKKFFKAS